MKDIELIEAYLMGSLDSTAKLEVQSRLEQETPFRTLMEELKTTIAVLERNWIKDRITVVKRRLLYRKLMYAGIIVAVLLGALLVAVRLLMSSPDPKGQVNTTALPIQAFTDSSGKTEEAAVMEVIRDTNSYQQKIVNWNPPPYPFQPHVLVPVPDLATITQLPADLNEMVQKDIMPAQVFHLNNTKDSTIHCSQGLEIFFKANSLETVSGKGQLRDVELQVKEFGDYHTMWQNKVTTCSDSRLLESGGSCWIGASSGGEEVLIKKGDSFNLQFPTTYQATMSTFYGDRDTAGELNWKQREMPVVKPVKVVKMKDAKFRKDGKQVEYEEKSDRFMPDQDGEVNMLLSDTIFYLEPIVSLEGTYEGNKHRFVNVEDEAALQSLFDTLVSISSEEAKTLYIQRKTMLIRFGVSGEGRMTKFDYNFILPKKLERQFKQRAQYIVDTRRINMKGLDFNSGILNVTMKPLFRIRDSPFNDSNLNKAGGTNEKKKLYNAIVSSTFGYINCDQFLRQKNLADIKVRTEWPRADIRVFFANINSVALCTYNSKGLSVFRNAPDGAPILILASVLTKQGLMMKILEAKVGDDIELKGLEPLDLVTIKQRLLSYRSAL